MQELEGTELHPDCQPINTRRMTGKNAYVMTWLDISGLIEDG